MKTSIFALFMGGLLASGSIAVYAEEPVSSENIIQNLKPKAKTRGLGAAPSGLSEEDAEFIQGLKSKTRGITIEERDELSKIVEKAAMPSIDLEINFALNSADLEPSAVVALQQLGAALASPALASGSFLVAGHTDARGSKDYNQILSEKRAQKVKSFLTQNFAIADDRLLAVGYGQEQLKNTADPYADENRRVKIINIKADLVASPAKQEGQDR